MSFRGTLFMYMYIHFLPKYLYCYWSKECVYFCHLCCTVARQLRVDQHSLLCLCDMSALQLTLFKGSKTMSEKLLFAISCAHFFVNNNDT